MALFSILIACYFSVATPDTSSIGLAALQDTVKAENDTTIISKGFNALNYRLQKRYRPKDEPFINSSFLDNFYLKTSFGAFQLAQRDYSSFSWGGIGGIEIGKLFNRYNSISLGLSGLNFRRNVDGSKVSSIGLEALHYFDISSYLGGYHPSRVFSVSTIEAFGIDLSTTDGELNLAGHVRLGIDLRVKIIHFLDVFLEPSISVYTDGIDNYKSVNWKKYNSGYGISSGIVLRIPSNSRPDPNKNKAERNSLGLSIDCSGGIAFQASELVINTVGLLPSARESINIALGIPISGPLSLRTSLFYSRDVWKRLVGSVNKFSYYLGLRGELMFDPLYYFDSIRNTFSLPLLVGPEYGYMLKYDHTYDIKRQYFGLSTGVQFRYRLNAGMSIYMEPHLSIVPYNYRQNLTDSLSSATSNYYDTIYSFLIGVSIPI